MKFCQLLQISFIRYHEGFFEQVLSFVLQLKDELSLEGLIVNLDEMSGWDSGLWSTSSVLASIQIIFFKMLLTDENIFQ